MDESRLPQSMELAQLLRQRLLRCPVDHRRVPPSLLILERCAQCCRVIGDEVGRLLGSADDPGLDVVIAEAGAACLWHAAGERLKLPGRRVVSQRSRGFGAHGSMPHLDNAALKLAEAVTRLAAAPQPARVTPVVEAFLAALGLVYLVVFTIIGHYAK